MQDDVGNQVALPKVVNDAEVGRLVGAYVTVTGAPNVDPAGKLTHVEEASVELAPGPLGARQMPKSPSLQQILASAPGPALGGIAGLTEAEAEAFLEAIG